MPNPLVIDLPCPPSANRLWRTRRIKGRVLVYKDPKYEKWLRSCWYYWHTSKPVHFKTIQGPFDAEILICPPRKRDADNSAKALLDGAQSLGIIHNDSQARRVTQELVEKDRAPLGVRLTVTPL